MTDAPHDVEARFDELMRRRSGCDRIRMMSEMFDFARTLVLSSLRAAHGGATEADLRVLLFERLYGGEIDPAEHSHIVARLRGQTRT